MEKIVEIKRAKSVGNPDVVEALESALVDARAGHITGVVMVTQHQEQYASYATAGLTDRWATIGYISHLLHRLHSDRKE